MFIRCSFFSELKAGNIWLIAGLYRRVIGS
jgi:hypothetical protein